MFENYSTDQLKRIYNYIIALQKENLSGYEEADVEKLYEFTKNYLTDNDIIAFVNMTKEYKSKKNKNQTFNKIDPSSIKVRQSFELKWQEVTPYTILGIEEREYTKEELLTAVELQIKCCQLLGKNEEIDSILDAYNELTKTSSKKR